ncbi:MAG: hypothetical protein C0501_25505 [Isosphaera sp.]|nr:hypothetical protein [Isosphaera sp.]
MSYRLLYTGKAVGQLTHLPAGFLDAVEENLHRLAAAPVSLSVPVASPPFPPRGQLFHFEADDPAGAPWFFTVIIRYSQDETALHVLSVTWRELIDE